MLTSGLLEGSIGEMLEKMTDRVETLTLPRMKTRTLHPSPMKWTGVLIFGLLLGFLGGSMIGVRDEQEQLMLWPWLILLLSGLISLAGGASGIPGSGWGNQGV